MDKKLLQSIMLMLCMALISACGSSSEPSPPDADGDSIPDSRDNCIQVANKDQLNTDGDSAGDACDIFPKDGTETADFDGNGLGDNADLDDDKDGVEDVLDAFPFDVTEWEDADADQIGDNADLDPTNSNPNSILLDQLIANGRVTKFIGGVSNIEPVLGDLVKNIGDVNGDGLNDLFISLSRYIIPEEEKGSGLGYILFGQANGWPATVDLSDLSEIPHIVLQSGVDLDPIAFMGDGLAPLGDIDGDGIDDFMISASYLAHETLDLRTGAVFLVFGRSTWIEDAGDDSIITLDDLKNYSVKFQGAFNKGLLGSRLENVGDLNNDGFPEVAISENTNGTGRKLTDTDFGTVHLMFNIGRYSKANISEVHNINDISNTADTLNRVVVTGDNDTVGDIIQGMGDFNHDGYDDVVIRDKRILTKSDSGYGYGALYVLFGKESNAWPDTWDLTTLAQGEGFTFKSEQGEDIEELARDLKVADLNTDGIPDLITSLSQALTQGIDQSGVNEVYVLWGGAKNWPASIDAKNISPELGLGMVGEQNWMVLGMQVEVVPDSNNNGYPEILLATDNVKSNSDGLQDPNTIYKFDASLIRTDLEIGETLFNNGDAEYFKMIETEVDVPFFMNVLDDMNGDGLSEMTFSATYKDSNGLTDNGEFYLLYGYDQLYPQVFKAGEMQ